MPSKNELKYWKQKEKEHQNFIYNKRKAYQVKNMKEYEVNKESLLLDFLLNIYRDQSRNNVKMLLSKHFVGVNGLGVSQFNYQLYRGDMVQISKVPFEKMATKKVDSPHNKVPLKLDIIYEDDNYLVINKPSGLLTIESDKEKTDTAYKLVLEYMQKYNVNQRAFQVHRIDKETSGVLMFVKNYELKELLIKNWNKLVKKREYTAVVEGIMEKKDDTIISWLKETSTNLMYDSCEAGNGFKAITNYHLLANTTKYSLLDVIIETGRKNQIRVAMASIGHPVVGDDKYGNPTNPIKRLGLHASCLVIKDPITGNLLTFKAKVPFELKKMFKL